MPKTTQQPVLELESHAERMQNVLVPIDFSPATSAAIRMTTAVARAYGSFVRLLHVAPPDPTFAHPRSWPQEVRDELAKELKTEHDELRALANRLESEGIQTRALLARGEIVDTIVATAHETETDLILLTTRRVAGLAQLRPQGVIRGILRKAPCKILVVPLERHEHPRG